MKRIFAVLSLVLLAAFAFPSTVMAGGLYDGKVIFGTDFTLESGETLDGELLVFGGSVTMEPESRVTGDVVLFGGNVTSDGEIEGNLAVLGGNVILKSQAVVQGDVILLGGNVQKQEGAQILGQEVSETSFDIPFDFHWVGPDIRWPSLSPASLAGQGLWFLFRCFMLAALAMLVILFLPEPTKRVAAAVVEQPLMAGGLGLLTAILTPIVLILLVVFIITIPLAILLVFAVIVAVLFGWIAIGLEVGHRLADIFKWDLHPAAAAGLGTFLFSVVVLGIGFVPCVGWTAQVIVSFLATGAILLTRFGSLSYSFKSASTPTDALEVQDAPEADKTDEADEG
jgi:cytoskeletal protein CcmA (bactofilin family)